MGPPLAIAINIGIAVPGSSNGQKIKNFRHVVQLTTANGATQQTAGTTSTQ